MNAENRASRTERGERNVVLTARDLKIIYTVGRFSLASTRHLTALFFQNKNTANKRLRSLFSANFLRAHLLLGSTSPTIYTLAPAGLEALVKRMGVDRKLVRIPKTLDVADLQHRLVVVDTRVAIVLAARECPALRLVRFLTGAEVHGLLKDAGANVVPDALVLLERNAKPESLALEVDLGTEALGVWRHKAAGYARMMAAGFSLFGLSDWRVLVIAAKKTRLRSIASVLLEAGPADRFLLVDLAELTPRIFVKQAWSPASSLVDPNARPAARRKSNG
jgi:hypothetical protein